MAELFVGTSIILVMISLIAGLLIYFLPGFIAFSRLHHDRGWILMLNIVFGWTLLGWLAALVWSLMTPDRREFQPFPVFGDTKVCPRCAERVKRAAFVCRYCGYEFGAAPPLR